MHFDRQNQPPELSRDAKIDCDDITSAQNEQRTITAPLVDNAVATQCISSKLIGIHNKQHAFTRDIGLAHYHKI